MRIFPAGVLVILLAGTVAAQEKTRHPLSDFQPSLRDFQTQQIPSNFNEQKVDLRSLVIPRSAAARSGPTNDRCFFIHSFVFEREDGSAPRLKRETVCTPATAVLKSAR